MAVKKQQESADEPFTDEELIAAGQEPIGTGAGSKAIEQAKSPFGDEQLAEVSSYEDALALVAQFTTEHGIELQDAIDAFGTGFEIINDKSVLVGTPFIIMGWHFYIGDYGYAVAIQAVTEDGRKIVFNDGSTGIYQSVREFTDKHGKMPISCRKGLRASTYQRKDDNGELMFNPANQPMMATTYYF